LTPEEPLFVALTLDVDPDANRPEPGRPDAVSPGGEARWDACLDGLERLTARLAERPVPATFFWEGRALQEAARRRADLLERLRENPRFEHGTHGMEHEDFTGEDTGVRPGAAETREAIERVGAAYREAFGAAPLGFRAPYCRLTSDLIRALQEAGYRYDASRTVRASGTEPLVPRLLSKPGLWEVPLCRSRDGDGLPISGYLWQLLEGSRRPGEYVEMARALRGPCAGGLLQIALHPWHLVVSAEGNPLERDGPALVGRVLDGVAALDGVQTTTVGGYLERWTAMSYNHR
jgi:hypothetical protein